MIARLKQNSDESYADMRVKWLTVYLYEIILPTETQMGSDRMKRYPIMKELNALNDIKEALNQLQGQSL